MRLIDDWKVNLKKAWSIRLAGFAAIVAAYFTQYPEQLIKLGAMVPEPYREFMSIVIGLLVFSLATGTRLAKQGSNKNVDDGFENPDQ